MSTSSTPVESSETSTAPTSPTLSQGEGTISAEKVAELRRMRANLLSQYPSSKDCQNVAIQVMKARKMAPDGRPTLKELQESVAATSAAVQELRAPFDKAYQDWCRTLGPGEYDAMLKFTDEEWRAASQTSEEDEFDEFDE
ncbi:hypothetical protein FB45DRAFT_1037875 [Roridomyces roridus]|uniref:Uncharacterized protein n=1 Tax=Roridomyces roridus TaxID=1738132 RepID=A0AAD7B650_9AGAR|nr:hypothetical protein FB45DRAFT_1037875 [Roridomyces roridus]